MRFKKVIAAIALAAGLTATVTACSQKPSNEEVIKQVNKHKTQSFHMTQDMTMEVNGQKQDIKQEITFGGNPMTAKATSSAAGQEVKMWTSGTNQYISAGDADTWYKTKITDPTQSADKIAKSMKNSNNILAANKEIAKNASIKEDGDNYVITVKNNKDNNDAISKSVYEAITKMGNTNQTDQAKEIAKQMKIKNFTFTETVDKKTYKVKKLTSKGTISVEGVITMNFKQVMDHINGYPHLKVPADVENNAKLLKSLNKK